MHYVSFLNKVSPIKLVLPVLTGRCWRRCSTVSAPSREMWPMLVCTGGHHRHRYHHHHCHDCFEPKVWPWSPDHLSLLPDRHHSFKPGSILPTGETRFSRVAVCNLWFLKKREEIEKQYLTQPDIGLIGLIDLFFCSFWSVWSKFSSRCGSWRWEIILHLSISSFWPGRVR